MGAFAVTTTTSRLGCSGADRLHHQFVDTLIGRAVQDSHAPRYGDGSGRRCRLSKTIVISASVRSAKVANDGFTVLCTLDERTFHTQQTGLRLPVHTSCAKRRMRGCYARPGYWNLFFLI